jgi:CHASE2 domain-containing sensor protein
MKIKSEVLRKAIAILVITISLSLGMIAAYLGGLFNYLEYKLYDFRVNIFAPLTRPSDDIIVVLLDQESIDWAQRERGWGWPWPRAAYGEIIDYLRLGGAKSLAFDVIFSEPSIYRNARQDEILDSAVNNLQRAQAAIAREDPQAAEPLFAEAVSSIKELSAREDDAAFARASQRFGRTAQIVVFSTQTGTTNSWPRNLNTPLFELHNFENIRS